MNSKQSSRYIKRRMGNELKNKILEYNGIITEEKQKKKPSISNCHRCSLVNTWENKYCSKCRYEFWLANNADSIERYMAAGYSFDDAKTLVRRDNDTKLNCLSCGEEMKPATNGQSFFCSKTVRCKTAHRRLKYLVYNRIPRIPKETALKQVLEELE